MLVLKILFKKGFLVFASLTFSAFLLADEAVVRPINIVSSNALKDVVQSSADYFGQLTKFRTPSLEIAEHDDEYNMFCGYAAKNNQNQVSYDAVFSLRKIRQVELIKCQKNNINDLQEELLGYIAVLFVQNKAAETLNLSHLLIYNAMVGNILRNGVVIKNPYIKWSDIGSTAPNRQIQIYAAKNNVLNSIIKHTIIAPECMSSLELRNIYLGYEMMRKKCVMLRSDGRLTEYDKNLGTILQRLQNDRNPIIIINYNDFIKNQNILAPISVEGIFPTLENIKSGKYTLASPMFVYYKKSMLKNLAGLLDFINALHNAEATGDNGYLSKFGLIDSKM